RGIEPGDRVLICAPNSPDWIASYFGTVSIGAIAVPVDDQAGVDLLRCVRRHAAPRYAFTTRRHVERLAGTTEGFTDHRLLDSTSGAGFDDFADGAPTGAAKIEQEQIASLLYTSGTTGTPKAVPLSHRNLAS